MPRPVSAPMRSKLLPSGFSWGKIWAIAALRFVDTELPRTDRSARRSVAILLSKSTGRVW